MECIPSIQGIVLVIPGFIADRQYSFSLFSTKWKFILHFTVFYYLFFLSSRVAWSNLAQFQLKLGNKNTTRKKNSYIFSKKTHPKQISYTLLKNIIIL